MMEKLEEIDKFMNSNKTIPNKKLIKELYENKKDIYSKEKLNLCKNNLTQYWCGLSEDKKDIYKKLFDGKLELKEYTKVVKYGYNETCEKIIKELWDGRIGDDEKEKLTNLRNNISEYWNMIEEDEKIKYLKLSDEYYKEEGSEECSGECNIS